MVKNSENNGTEEIGLVTPTTDQTKSYRLLWLIWLGGKIMPQSSQ